MNGTSSTIERRNQRISARLRRIQGQIVALERSLANEPALPSLHLVGPLYVATTVRRSESINLRWGSPVRSHRISGSVIGRQSRSETAVWLANSSVDAADSYFASTACSDNTLRRYNVNTFLNSATTRTFSLGSASS
jgi:hypothetical protein